MLEQPGETLLSKLRNAHFKVLAVAERACSGMD
jgi:hypothetical protein